MSRKVTTTGDIYRFLDSFAPFCSAMDFDNVGLLVGGSDVEVHTVLLSLDITAPVVREAAENHAELIISHHPVIFQPIKSMAPNDVPYLLAQNGIAAICAHTNLDMAPGGVNTCLAERLQLTDGKALKEYNGSPEGFIGSLNREYTPREFAEFVKSALDCGGLKYVDGGRKIKIVGLCSGAGADLLCNAAALGADAFVTADTKHHELLLAAHMGVTLVDAGHFNTEDVVIQPLLKKLTKQFPDVQFQKSQQMRDPANYI
jgi:dinuclear metal center YbgI/SA1388 family protein